MPGCCACAAAWHVPAHETGRIRRPRAWPPCPACYGPYPAPLHPPPAQLGPLSSPGRESQVCSPHRAALAPGVVGPTPKRAGTRPLHHARCPRNMYTRQVWSRCPQQQNVSSLHGKGPHEGQVVPACSTRTLLPCRGGRGRPRPQAMSPVVQLCCGSPTLLCSADPSPAPSDHSMLLASHL